MWELLPHEKDDYLPPIVAPPPPLTPAPDEPAPVLPPPADDTGMTPRVRSTPIPTAKKAVPPGSR
jgi:hypothetical protein